jgi:guanylate kinase
MQQKTPKLIIIGGPSGCGKTTIGNFISENFPNVVYYKNQWTTRKPRPGEEGKGAYQSVSLEKFKELENNNILLMKTKFAGNYYWYTRDFINDIKENFNEKQSLVIDSIQPIKNWLEFKKKFTKIPLVTIFLFADIAQLKLRVIKRKNSSLKDISLRMEYAQKVLSESKLYNYKIDTTDFSKAEAKITTIINNIFLKINQNL